VSGGKRFDLMPRGWEWITLPPAGDNVISADVVTVMVTLFIAMIGSATILARRDDSGGFVH
jgi:hypothetical protein